MVAEERKISHARSAERLALSAFASIMAHGRHIGEGRILDVSKHGCLVERPALVKAGDHLELRLFLPETRPFVSVSSAVIRWTHGLRFGVEFMEVGETHQDRLHHFLALRADLWKLAY